MNRKTSQQRPLGARNYGHIAHLPGSRLGPKDYSCNPGHAVIATEQVRDRHDLVIVLEKLDGSNVGIARSADQLYALTRAGYDAATSVYEHHRRFAEWVHKQQDRFLAILEPGERLCGEWLLLAHGTRYALPHEPLVIFDLMRAKTRLPYNQLLERTHAAQLTTPALLHRGAAVSIEAALEKLGTYGFHGALDPAEGAVWRVERNELIHAGHSPERAWRVDFLVKYVRPTKQDGGYLPELSGQPPIWNSFSV